MIDGVKILERYAFGDERGEVMHIMKRSDENFQKFGDVYCSTVRKEVVKGWNYHKEATINFTVIRGLIKLVLFDTREKSSTKNEKCIFSLGIDNYSSISVPPKIWYAFKGQSQKKAYIINFMNLPYNPNELLKMDAHEKEIINHKW